MFRRINPTLKFPILISYEIPDSDEVVDRVETQAESLVEEEVSEEDPEETVVEEEVSGWTHHPRGMAGHSY